jgi:hypothetical protein
MTALPLSFSPELLALQQVVAGRYELVLVGLFRRAQAHYVATYRPPVIARFALGSAYDGVSAPLRPVKRLKSRIACHSSITRPNSGHF